MQNETLKVTGMTCGGCTSKVANALKSIVGVREVVVSLAAGEAAVRYDETQATPDQLKSAVKGAGFGVDSISNAPALPTKGGCCS